MSSVRKRAHYGSESDEQEVPKKKRVKYLLEEEEKIKQFFKSRKATLTECRAFLEESGLDRTPKQIQDKIKQLFATL